MRRDDWMKRVEAVLKGAAFDERLMTETPDGFRLAPIYSTVDGPRAAREAQQPWTLFQRTDHPEPHSANAQALDDLANGATGLNLVIKGCQEARGCGLDVASLARVLQGVPLHATALRVEGNGGLALADLISRLPLDPERMNVSFGLKDPSAAQALSRRGFTATLMEADGRPWHERGATDAEELGAVLAEAVSFLRSLEQLNDVLLVRAVGVTLTATQDMFATIAKFRAMRLLWARVLDVVGLPEQSLRLHGETSWKMMASLDPHTNILRATAAVFGSGLGGAESICVLPFSITQGLPNRLARRVARNVQTVLMEESNLWRVADPASGSGYVETLTEMLCQRAWRVFQDAESGRWPSPDSSCRVGEPVVGTSVYRLKTEYPAEVETV